MQRLEVSGEVRPIYGSLGVKRLKGVNQETDSWSTVFIDELIFVQLFKKFYTSWSQKFHDYSYESLCWLRKMKRNSKGKKVKFTLAHATKAQRGEWRYSSTVSLTLALDEGGWSTPCPGCFTLRKDPVPIV